MTDKTITLRADLPDVVETPIQTEISCGDTSVQVAEHGYRGRGAWAVWTSGHVISGGTNDYPYERAIADALAHVRREERRRLLHAQLRDVLAAEGAEGGEQR